MARKQRVDSAAGQVLMASAASKGHQSPLPLSDDERVVFNDLLQARDISSWSKAELRLVASYAKIACLWVVVFDESVSEGMTLINDRGTPVPNPKVAQAASLLNQLQGLTKVMGLTATQTGKAGRDAKAANAASAAALDAVDKAASGSLLA